MVLQSLAISAAIQVLVEFKDGKFTAGVFGEQAEVYTTPDPQALLPSQQWGVDEHGDVIAPLLDSLGVMISDTAEIRSVRVLVGGGSGSQQPKSGP
jgi:hypothetical protein